MKNDKNIMDNIIEVKNLTKYYDEVLAVDHINFEVKRGEIFGFLGPNGAGKTTTIRILTAFLKPDEGTALVSNYDILKNPLEVKQYLGVVPEVSNVYVDLTAWENLMLMGELYGVPKEEREENAVKLLKNFGLYDVRKKLTKGFSKGMKQKLLLCMALINNPEILFLDEPTSGLDVESARLMREKVQQLNREGKTIFLSTHNMEEVNQLCHRIAIINHGKIAAIDTPENLRAQSRELQYIEVLFDKPVNLEKLAEKLKMANVVPAGNKFRIYTASPHIIIENLVDFSRENNLKILDLDTMMPSLEDIFIKLIKQKI
jgi:ABC-2 type transport system ATP-binding protein